MTQRNYNREVKQSKKGLYKRQKSLQLIHRYFLALYHSLKIIFGQSKERIGKYRREIEIKINLPNRPS